jgi:hypothetical protein
MKRGIRFWLAYALAWVPYAASYIVIFLQQGAPLSSSIADALINVISAAVLGVLVLSATSAYDHNQDDQEVFLNCGCGDLMPAVWRQRQRCGLEGLRIQERPLVRWSLDLNGGFVIP